MKDILLKHINNDISYNKSFTRYMYKTHPDLWKQVLNKTTFLPDTAKPRQRVWHIVNEIWKRPTCPITNEITKWGDHSYATYSSRSAKATHLNLTGKLKNRGKDVDAKRRKTYNKRYAAGEIIKVEDRNIDYVKGVETTKQTCMAKYGVTNGSKTLEARKKISDSHIKNGATPLHLRSSRRIYYDAVWLVTEQSWKDSFDKINPERINRSENALDHIYSIQQGFRDNIDPNIIGHWTNLRIITLSENSIKGMRCDKSKIRLLEDYNLYN